MLDNEIKNAILNGAFAVTRSGDKVQYIGKSSMPDLNLSFIQLPSEPINYYKPFEDINVIFVDDVNFKAIPSTMEDNHNDIVGLWVEPTPKVTLELPKPFKPKLKETFFTVSAPTSYRPLEVRETYNSGNTIDNELIEVGLCFKTEEDAQAWIDAFKKALKA